mgnify:CR=1 FL=1
MSNKTIAAVLFGFTIASPLPLSADIEFKRPLQLYKEQGVRIGAEYSYFDLGLDFLDYAGSLEGRSTPERNEATRLDLHIPLAERITLDYQRSNNEGLVTRSAQPFTTITKGLDHQLEATYWLFRSSEYSLFVHAGLKYAKQDPVNIDCYDVEGLLVVGGSCEEADLQLIDREIFYNERRYVYQPAISTDANTLGFKVGATLTNQILGFSSYQYIGFEQTEINVRTSSGFLDITDEFFRQVEFEGKTVGDMIDEIKFELPQSDPWLEQSAIVEAGVEIPLNGFSSITTSLTHHFVSRDGYAPGPQNKDYDNNTILNLAVWFRPNDIMSLYLRGEASTNNVLGIEPIAYNRKTSKYFKHPFGQLSLGFTIKLP